MDYEWAILALSDEESTVDECADCQYKGEKCRTQCEEETVIYNPNLK